MLLTPRVLEGLLGMLLKMLEIQNILIPSLHQNGVILYVGMP